LATSLFVQSAEKLKFSLKDQVVEHDCSRHCMRFI